MNIMRMRKGSGLMAKFVTALVVVFLCYAVPAAAQNKPKEESVSTKAVKHAVGAKDENVKSDSDKNDAKVVAKAPGGVRGAGPYPCYVRVENETPWKAFVYIDGTPVGMVPRYGSMLVRTGNGISTAYAKAYFVDGSSLSWGTHVFNCDASMGYVWHFTP
jgi:hypothetical protein